jgi:phosphopantothenoylcysteine synthetase/decarboxylase
LGDSEYDDPVFDHMYFVVSGAGTARRAPELLRRLIDLGPGVMTLLTPNASRVLAPRELTAVIAGRSGHCVVESYFDDAIVPRPPRGVVLFAPCTFGSLNKLALGIADNLALSVVSEAIGRRTPVIVAVSVNAPLWAHPRARQSVNTLREWGVRVVEPVTLDETLTMATDDELLALARAAIARGDA